MMHKFTQSISSFTQRGGIHIFSSTILLRTVQFVLSVLLIRLLSKDQFGDLSYAFSITQLIIPFSGGGLYLSLLHYASIRSDAREKLSLFSHTIRRGFIYSLLLVAIILLSAGLLTSTMPSSAVYLRLFCLYILAYHFFHSIVSLLRVKKRNKAYALSLTGNALLVLALSLTGILVANGKGYVIGFSLAPALTASIIFIAIKRKDKEHYGLFRHARDLPIKAGKYTRYGMFAGLGNVASQMAWQLDTIMIGILLAQSTQVATYKAASLIPFSLIFIPSVFMQTDFVYIAEKYEQKKYLINYYKKYLMVFLLITAVILGTWYSCGDMIVRIFGSEYIDAKPLINILMINVFSTFLFRVPLGNILAAVGKASWNSYSAIVLLGVNLLLNLWLIPLFGIYGAAYATVSSIALSSLLNVILFLVYLKQLDKKVPEA
jgi:O-antigen/teichoic acid export membrane protein